MSVVYLESEEGKGELRWLLSILRQSYGPLGIAAMFQPSPRGCVTLTSRSERLLSMLKTTSPVGRLLLNSLESHAHLHKDSGLYAGLLSIDLILRGMELMLPRHQVAVVTSHALSLITDHLCDDSSDMSGVDLAPCKCQLELSSMSEVMSLLRCFLCSKTAVCQLSNVEVDKLASLLLQCFLKAAQKKSAISFAIVERVNIHTSIGRPVTQSCLLPGLLMECPQDSDGEMEMLVERLRERGRDIITALFDTSLAGDLPDEFPRDLRLITEDPSATEGRHELEAVMLRRLMSGASRLVAMGVRFVGCQKAMHPLLKDYWRENVKIESFGINEISFICIEKVFQYFWGVVAVDRLSAVNLGPVRDLTGGRLISSLSTGLSPDHLGRLKAIRHTIVYGKRYMVLESESGHCSLLLCCQTDCVADELHPLCSSALCILQQCLYSPYVLHGGGCTETQLSYFLLSKASEDCSSDLLKELQCNEKTFKVVMKSVAISFRAIAAGLEHHGGTVLTDSSSHHCWFFPPECHTATQIVGNRYHRDDKSHHSARCVGVGARNVSSSSSRTVKNSISSKTSAPLRLDKKQLDNDNGEECSGCSGVCGGETGGELRKEEEQLRREESRFASEKTCGCGCVRLSDLPSTCEWISLGDNKCSTFVPDSIKHCLKSATMNSIQTRNSVETKSFPCVCDAFLPKLKAIEMANDLATTVLRIAFSISEK